MIQTLMQHPMRLAVIVGVSCLFVGAALGVFAAALCAAGAGSDTSALVLDPDPLPLQLVGRDQ